MTPEKSTHLSEEAINDVLIGLGTAESDAHLAVCSICNSHLKQFRVEMEAFNETTLAWSEARPTASLRATRRSKVRAAMYSPLGWALAAVLLIAIGIPVRSHYQSSLDRASVQAPAPGDTQAQIEKDNDLLRSVDVALNENEESPISAYHISEAPRHRARTRPDLRKP
jgi:hypothetical protein